MIGDPVSQKNEAWNAGPRARVESLRVGTRFLSIDGDVFKITRHERDVTYVEDASGKASFFANCAEGVVQS